MFIKQLIQACIQPLFWALKAVQIKVLHFKAIQFITLNNGVSRAFDRALKTPSAQQAAGERGFACTQITGQIHG